MIKFQRIAVAAKATADLHTCWRWIRILRSGWHGAVAVAVTAITGSLSCVTRWLSWRLPP